MSETLKIAIAEPSAVVRVGLETILKKLPGFRFRWIEIPTADILTEQLRMYRPDLLLINPCMAGNYAIGHLKEDTGCRDMKCVALLYHLVDNALLRPYDEQVSICDSPDDIRLKLEQLFSETVEETTGDEQQVLSSREKEIVVCVVKGMTNREIADHLFLSTHTVITHRRNIARKLQIHSPSGLTIYAIVNKLVELGDIQS